MLREFVVRQWLGQPHSPALLDWLADAINAVLGDEKPLDAFALSPRPSHRPADAKNTIDVTLWVAETQARGYTRQEAIARAAELFAKDPKTVERYLKRAGDWGKGRNADADWDAFFLGMKPPRPLPPRRDGK